VALITKYPKGESVNGRIHYGANFYCSCVPREKDVAASSSASELTFIVIMASNPEPGHRCRLPEYPKHDTLVRDAPTKCVLPG